MEPFIATEAQRVFFFAREESAKPYPCAYTHFAQRLPIKTNVSNRCGENSQRSDLEHELPKEFLKNTRRIPDEHDCSLDRNAILF